MKVVKAYDVPIYEVTCTECKSVIRYKKSEVNWSHINCPVCGVSLWADTISPVANVEEQEAKPCKEKIKAGDVILDLYECRYCKNVIRKSWKHCPFCGKAVT